MKHVVSCISGYVIFILSELSADANPGVQKGEFDDLTGPETTGLVILNLGVNSNRAHWSRWNGESHISSLFLDIHLPDGPPNFNHRFPLKLFWYTVTAQPEGTRF